MTGGRGNPPKGYAGDGIAFSFKFLFSFKFKCMFYLWYFSSTITLLSPQQIEQKN